MSEKFIEVNDVVLCTESFGNPSDPAILLVMGAMASMLWWDEEFCKMLASKGRFIIRYDNRDTGRSTTYPPGEPPYSVDDMMEDAIGVLDAYGIKEAHMFGMSLGGMIVQMAALKYPERVKTISLIMSEPLGVTIPDIPWVDEKVLSYHSQAATLDWNNEEAVVDYNVGAWKLLSGTRHPFNEERICAIASADYKHADNLLSAFNHAQLKGGASYTGKLKDLEQPALIFHGTEDIVVNYKNAVVLHEEIKDSKLIPLEGAGHELHLKDWDYVIDEIIKHTT